MNNLTALALLIVGAVCLATWLAYAEHASRDRKMAAYRKQLDGLKDLYEREMETKALGWEAAAAANYFADGLDQPSRADNVIQQPATPYQPREQEIFYPDTYFYGAPSYIRDWDTPRRGRSVPLVKEPAAPDVATLAAQMWKAMFEFPVIIPCGYCSAMNAVTNPTCVQCGGPMEAGYSKAKQDMKAFAGL